MVSLGQKLKDGASRALTSWETYLAGFIGLELNRFPTYKETVGNFFHETFVDPISELFGYSHIGNEITPYLKPTFAAAFAGLYLTDRDLKRTKESIEMHDTIEKTMVDKIIAELESDEKKDISSLSPEEIYTRINADLGTIAEKRGKRRFFKPMEQKIAEAFEKHKGIMTAGGAYQEGSYMDQIEKLLGHRPMDDEERKEPEIRRLNLYLGQREKLSSSKQEITELKTACLSALEENANLNKELKNCRERKIPITAKVTSKPEKISPIAPIIEPEKIMPSPVSEEPRMKQPHGEGKKEWEYRLPLTWREYGTSDKLNSVDAFSKLQIPPAVYMPLVEKAKARMMPMLQKRPEQKPINLEDAIPRNDRAMMSLPDKCYSGKIDEYYKGINDKYREMGFFR